MDILFAPPSWQIKLEEYQRHRLLVYFGKDFAPANATPERSARRDSSAAKKSYQRAAGIDLRRLGRLRGKGWREGNQTALGFLPPGAAHTDFIFSVIAEEKGFCRKRDGHHALRGGPLHGIEDRRQALRDRLGQSAGGGVVTLLFSHIFINIGMNIRLMPVTGIPTAAVILRRVFSAGLHDRARHVAKRSHLSKGILTMSNDKRFGGDAAAGMRFKPSGGLNQNQPPRTTKDAIAARAEAVGEVVGGHGQEKLFERRRKARSTAPRTSPPVCRPKRAGSRPGHEHQHQAAAPLPPGATGEAV